MQRLRALLVLEQVDANSDTLPQHQLWHSTAHQITCPFNSSLAMRLSSPLSAWSWPTIDSCDYNKGRLASYIPSAQGQCHRHLAIRCPALPLSCNDLILDPCAEKLQMRDSRDWRTPSCSPSATFSLVVKPCPPICIHFQMRQKLGPASHHSNTTTPWAPSQPGCNHQKSQ